MCHLSSSCALPGGMKLRRLLLPDEQNFGPIKLRTEVRAPTGIPACEERRLTLPAWRGLLVGVAGERPLN